MSVGRAPERRLGRTGARCGRLLGAVAGIVGVLSLAPAGHADTDAAAARDRFDTVVIDPGHGGEDDGARGARGLAEKTLVLDVSRRIAAHLRERGLDVRLTREDDTFVPLEVRTSVANDARADLFVSIHANSAPSDAPSGIETFFVSLDATDESARRVAARENEAFGERGVPRPGDDPLVALLGDMMLSEHISESSEFSKLVQSELDGVVGADSRGVKQAPFVVLMGVQMPASLIEIGFLSNAQDERALGDSAHREAIAEAVARAITDFGQRYDARRGVGAVSRRAVPGGGAAAADGERTVE